MQLLLLPGMDGTGALFRPLFGALPRDVRIRTVAYPPDQPMGYSELLPLVEQAASELGDFVVVGESFSGPLALMLAARRPAGVRGVVMVASFVRSPLPFGHLLSPLTRTWMFRWQPRWILQQLLLNGTMKSAIASVLAKALDEVRPEVLAARAKAILTVDATKELQDCRVPVLYLRARHDIIVGAHCMRLIRKLRPDAGVVEVDGPHLILQTWPEECAATLQAFERRT